MLTKPHQEERDAAFQVVNLESVTECLHMRFSNPLFCGFLACGNSFLNEWKEEG